MPFGVAMYLSFTTRLTVEILRSVSLAMFFIVIGFIDEAFSKDMIAKYDPVLKVMNKMGIKFTEKPERWVNIKARVSESKIAKLEEEIEQEKYVPIRY